MSLGTHMTGKQGYDRERMALIKKKLNKSTKRFQQMTKMNFKKIAWWFPRNFEALNTILTSKTTYDQYFGPLPALEWAFLAPPMHNWPFSAYNSRTKASTIKWVVPSNRSRSVDAKTCINFCVLTNICWFNAIWTWRVSALSLLISNLADFPWSRTETKYVLART